MLDPIRLRELVVYDPVSGRFWGGPSHALPGQPLFTYKNGGGYFTVKVEGEALTAHRTAWAIMRGEWPSHDVDHKNRDRTDNRWVNLRGATPSQNRWNKKFSGGEFGLIGVRRSRTGRRFRAIIKEHGRDQTIGAFACPTLAALAYDRRALELRGEFAVTNFLRNDQAVRP